MSRPQVETTVADDSHHILSVISLIRAANCRVAPLSPARSVITETRRQAVPVPDFVAEHRRVVGDRIINAALLLEHRAAGWGAS